MLSFIFLIMALPPLFSAKAQGIESVLPEFDFGLFVSQEKKNPRMLSEFRSILKTMGFQFRGTAIEDFQDPTEMSEPEEGARKFIYTKGNDTVILWIGYPQASDCLVSRVDVSSADYYEWDPLLEYLASYGYLYDDSFEGVSSFITPSKHSPDVETNGNTIFIYPPR